MKRETHMQQIHSIREWWGIWLCWLLFVFCIHTCSIWNEKRNTTGSLTSNAWHYGSEPSQHLGFFIIRNDSIKTVYRHNQLTISYQAKPNSLPENISHIPGGNVFEVA